MSTMSTMSTITALLWLISTGIVKADPHVCGICQVDTDCEQFVDQRTNITCQDFAGDGVGRCYFENENVVHLFDNPWDHRVCTWDGDAECLSLGGDVSEPGDNFEWYTSCLRCCPNSVVEKNLCTETISTGEEQCGVEGEALLFTTHVSAVYFANIAPCCAGETCLDNFAGICGVAGGPCDECTIWSFIINEDNEKHTGNSCGDGLVCLDDGSTPITENKPYFRPGVYNEIELIPPEERRRRRRRTLYDPPPEEPIIYTSGICVPVEGIESECTSDEECAGDCLRCCGGECKRIVSGDNCGLKRGPCCTAFDCIDNECVSPAPTPVPSDSDDSDDSDGSSEFSAIMNGESKSLNNENNKASDDIAYTISFNDKTQNNLLIMLAVIMVFAFGCLYCYFRKEKQSKHVMNDIDTGSNV